MARAALVDASPRTGAMRCSASVARPADTTLAATRWTGLRGSGRLAVAGESDAPALGELVAALEDGGARSSETAVMRWARASWSSQARARPCPRWVFAEQEYFEPDSMTSAQGPRESRLASSSFRAGVSPRRRTTHAGEMGRYSEGRTHWSTMRRTGGLRKGNRSAPTVYSARALFRSSVAL